MAPILSLCVAFLLLSPSMARVSGVAKNRIDRKLPTAVLVTSWVCPFGSGCRLRLVFLWVLRKALPPPRPTPWLYPTYEAWRNVKDCYII